MQAIERRLSRCHTCGKLAQVSEEPSVCPRCHTPLHLRDPYALSRAWAFTLTALVAFIPANLLPIMTVAKLDNVIPSTIMAGVIDLAKNDMLPIAIVVFLASIAVPVFKLIGIIYLLYTVQQGRAINAAQATRMYRFIDFIGRWSMLDLFVIAILATLVSFGKVASIEANPGASAFAAVVVLTLLAAKSFDPRLIWDLQEKPHNE